MDLGLKDRVYVVTGGTRGLGLAAARALTADGARVVVSGLKVTPETAAGKVQETAFETLPETRPVPA